MHEAPPELRARPHVLSVPAGVPFLDALAETLLDGGLLPGLAPLRNDPLALSDALVFLPTRRAVGEFETIITNRLGGAGVLPRVLALGKDEDDDNLFSGEESSDAGIRTVPELERRLVLARLIRNWAQTLAGTLRTSSGEADLVATSPGEAMSLAIALGRLIDSFETEGADWEKLVGLVPPEHDDIWKLTTNFLNIAAQFWPAFLAEHGLTGGAALTNARLRALARRLREHPPATPVIVAGSTGSNPATAELMEAVAHLPFGGVILHGLDIRSDDAAWEAIGGDAMAAQSWTHPQFFFHRLLTRMNVQRGEIGEIGKDDRARDARRVLAATALLPSDLTDRWRDTRTDARALDGVSIVTAANEREEALTIGVILREALETPDKTAALITPDRALARRVAAEMKRWDVAVEDSAGLPLADTSAGRLARLVAETAAAELAPETLIALLRHPDARFGRSADDMRRAADALEIGVLRGPAPPPGVDGLYAKLALEENATPDEQRYWHPVKAALGTEDWGAARELIAALKAALGPLCAYGQIYAEAPLRDIAAAHRDALVAVRAGAPADRDHDEIVTFLNETAAGSSASFGVRLADYPVLFKTMLRGHTARARTPGHPRLKILGTLEARLLGFDLTILGGLNETVWPAQTANDPFLSRPMRAALGLPPPEWRVGLSAHDFEQALGGREVVLTRSLKAGGAPAVAARWLQRLEAVADATAWKDARARGDAWRGWADALDRPSDTLPVLRGPAPRPPRDLRPKRLSVTEIETLIRDPYAIYARHVLRLRPMDEAGALPQASDRGNIIHAALAEFSEKHDVFDADAEAKLIALGRAAFAPYWDFPDVRALWWPRFERIAHWFVNWERARKPDIARTYTESRGKFTWITAAKRDFTLTGRGDRFDAIAKGYVVIDYKTGAPPSDKEVRAGFAPQLPLEAAMLARGAFDDVAPGEASGLVYVRLSGLAEGGEEKTVDPGEFTAHALGEDRLGKLVELIDEYENEENPYRSQTRPKFLRRSAGDYDHLARYAEWSLAPEPDEGENSDD